jgi:hypothetical protein
MTAAQCEREASWIRVYPEVVVEGSIVRVYPGMESSSIRVDPGMVE